MSYYVVRIIAATGIIAAVFLLTALLPPGEEAADVDAPVIVELFTSQGCSSCPPADRLLSQLREEGSVNGVPLIVLSEHVDYWNRLGWTDPYSAKLFSNRQRRYARAFGSGRVYTPQMIVNGGTEFVGHNRRAADAAITDAGKRRQLSVELKRVDDERLRIRVAAPLELARAGVIAGDELLEVVFVITEDDLGDDVRRGENAGRKLRHDGVVREMRVLQRIAGDRNAPFLTFVAPQLDKAWARGNLRYVVLVQEGGRRLIHGAAVIDALYP